MTLAPEHEGATLTGSLLNENLLHGLMYEEPNFKSLDKANITPEMIQLLDQYMDKLKMCDDHCYLWDEIMYQMETESDNEEEPEIEEQSIPLQAVKRAQILRAMT